MWDYAEVLRVRCLQDDTKPQELGLMHQAGRGDPFTYAALILDEGEVVFEAEVRQSTRSAGMQKKLLPVGELTAKWVKKHAKIENPFDESEDEREDAPEPATLTGVAAYRKIIQNPDRWFDLIERPLLKPPSDPKNCKTQLIETVKGIKFTLQGNIVDGRKHAAFLVWPTHGFEDAWIEFYWRGEMVERGVFLDRAEIAKAATMLAGQKRSLSEEPPPTRPPPEARKDLWEEEDGDLPQILVQKFGWSSYPPYLVRPGGQHTSTLLPEFRSVRETEHDGTVVKRKQFNNANKFSQIRLHERKYLKQFLKMYQVGVDGRTGAMSETQQNY
jgi:hypothetical protein